MSSEALAWAFKQQCPSSSVKFTLVALCECANYQTGRIFPSIAHISEITGQNRKTIIANIAELERQGFLLDTGERTGTTRQIKVYQATLGTVPKTEQSQKRNSTEKAPKESQKRDTEPSRTFKNKNTRAHLIPDGWLPSQFGAGTESRSIVDSWTEKKLQTSIEVFWSHHRARGNQFQDWQSAWSTWVLNSRKFENGNQRSNRNNSGSNGRAVDGFTAALRHVADGSSDGPW